jgi:hypothetical protein
MKNVRNDKIDPLRKRLFLLNSMRVIWIITLNV